VKRWWPDVPGRVEQVVFEWSPGRADRAYLGNRTSFDVAFILDLEDGQRGVIGVETKYHEHPVRVGIAPANLARYNDVSRASKLFEAATLELASRETCSQIWLDHLLALSMLQHPTDRWTWARFILVYADGNPSWQPLATQYRSMLRDDQTFATCTFDELLAADALEHAVCEALITRYRCW
jgi:hypothetical protein